MGVSNFQLSTNFSAKYQLTTIFGANSQLTTELVNHFLSLSYREHYSLITQIFFVLASQSSTN